MLRKRSLVRLGLLLGALLIVLVLADLPKRWSAGELLASNGAPRQNVIFVLTDDMRYDGVWALPNLARLAEERGVTFSKFFVTTPLCCPSRATALNGQYSHTHGVLSNTPPLGGVEAFDDSSTLVTWLRNAGVRTGLVGRYLNGYESNDIPPGWDFWFAMWQANESYSSYYDYRVNDNGTRRYYGSKEEMHSTRVFGKQALQFIQQDRQQPFMLLLAPRAPHGPTTPDRLDAGEYKDLEWPLPASYNEADLSDKPSELRRAKVLDKDEMDEIEVFRRRQFEALRGLDRELSTITDALAADGRMQNTWIIFSSDNGLMLGEHRRRYRKGCPYEECVRVPLVVIPPAPMAGPRQDDRLVANIDLAPTVAEIMGVRPDRTMDGRSLMPLLRDPHVVLHDSILLELLKGDEEEQFVGIRTPDLKYVRYPSGEEELYDQVQDPFELENRASDPGWVQARQQLSDQLDALLAESGATAQR